MQDIAPQVLAVNVSGVQFKGATELEREVEASLTRWSIAPSDIELELTESILMEASQKHSGTLDRLRQLGTRIAIDDFGTGYSSLKYLRVYPVNRLKLAQEFVYRVTVDYRNAAVVRAAIRLARELGLDVIAEGVKTEAQMRFLLASGCEHAQGHYFSRPVPAKRGQRNSCASAGSSRRPGAQSCGAPARRRGSRQKGSSRKRWRRRRSRFVGRAPLRGGGGVTASGAGVRSS